MLSLKECNNYSVKLVGGKAHWLGLVYQKLNVPSGICLTTEDYTLFIDKNKTQIDKLLKDIKNQPILMRKNLAQIRNILLKQQIESNLINEIIEKLHKEGINFKNGVAVRSSAVNEDLRSITNAGMYPSHLNIDNIKELEKSIKNIWLSSFTEQVYIANNYRAPKIAIIIQEMVRGDKYGVLFSQDPNNYTSKTIILEYSNQNRNVVNGQKPDVSLRINKNNFYDFLIPFFNKDNINSLGESLKTAENYLKSPVDIEWCQGNKELYILQARPLIVKENRIKNLVIIDSDNNTECSKYDLLNCKSHYLKHLGKHNSFRKLAKDFGINIYNSFYIIYNKKLLEQLTLEKIEKLIPSGLAMVSFGINSKTQFCNTNKLKEILINNENKNQKYTCAYIGENIPAELSGYVIQTKENNIMIEYVPGGVQFLKNGSVSPTALIIKEGGKIEYLQTPYYDKIVKTSLDTFRYEEYNYCNKAPKLLENEIQQICNYCRYFSKKIPNISLEWYIYNKKLFAKDISFEDNELEFEIMNSNVISRGTVNGKVIEITNLQKLENIASEYSPSLISHTKNDEIICQDPYISNLIENIKNCNTNVILKIDYPTLGLFPLLDYIKGVIFSKGSILCHIGIALRNKNIPAIINKTAFEKIKHLDNIILSENGIKVISTDLS